MYDMRVKIIRLYKSFRFKILLSFLSFIAIILVWVFAYFLINSRRNEIDSFKVRFTAVQNQFLENNRHLEYFILVGFHEPAFYSTGKQKDIDTFLSQQRNEIKYLEQTQSEAKAKRIKVDAELVDIIRLNKALLDSVVALKQLYFDKGYQYFGTEGTMWKYAHKLEDSSLIPRVYLLQLRRREKDYLLRGDQKYVAEYNQLLGNLLEIFQEGTPTGDVLVNYRKYFQLLVGYTDRLGIIKNDGLYNHVQDVINRVDRQYKITKIKTEEEVSNEQNFLHRAIIALSALFVVVVILLSWNVSVFLTKDIKALDQKISAFVRTRFKKDPGENNGRDPVSSGIAEIDHLNRNFLHLKRTLQASLSDLENSVLEEKKISNYKSTFIANVSHEIRTPLTGIIGMVHLLRGTKLSADQQELTETLDFSANHLRELVNMVLDYSKIEAGKLELEDIPFDLKGDITKLIKLFEYKIMEKGLNLELDYRVDCPNYVFGDPLRLQQVFLNLLNNAIKFTHTGFVRLRVIPISTGNDFVCVRFEVEDSGIGIAANEIDKLFNAFSQANTSISRQFGGTGLGLTISSQLIKLMGGQLIVRSEQGKGSLFSFEIKFKTGEPIKSRIKEPEQAKKYNVGLRILIAEDNLINQKVLSKMLEKYGAVADFANNGIEAVELFNINDYDLVLMDMQMPEMDGYEATIIICRSEKYKVRHTPVVAFSANAYDEDRKKAADAGMDDFLSKPIKPDELDGIVAKYSIKNTVV
jgi:signal transduction histidine kinase/CheY-like chemotaxis protein